MSPRARTWISNARRVARRLRRSSVQSDSRLAYLRRRPWRDFTLPPEVERTPTMLSQSERALLYALARDYAADDAAIVDAGSFLGGSTVALLAGLRDRPEPWRGPPLASYDRFRVEAYTISRFFGGSVRVGDSFRDLFDANVAGFDVPHDVHEGDIAQIGWSGGRIDVLFLDVLKSWKINDAVLRDFFPSLVPGRSVVVHQDYGWGYMPWIPITVELMWDSLTPIDRLEGGTHAFLVERELPAGLAERGICGLDRDEQLELVERAIDRAQGEVRGMLEIGRTALLVARDGRDAGLLDLVRIREQYARYPAVLECVAGVRAGLETDWTYGVASGGARAGRGP